MLVTVKPARLASIPHASPVGPAPITTTSKSDRSTESSGLGSMEIGYVRDQAQAQEPRASDSWRLDLCALPERQHTLSRTALHVPPAPHHSSDQQHRSKQRVGHRRGLRRHADEIGEWRTIHSDVPPRNIEHLEEP